MNLRQIEAFKAVIETGTVSQAAEILRISQPAASKLIANFERSAGFPVFDRVRGRLSPTPEALMLYGEVERAYFGLQEIARAAGDIRDLKQGRLTVGVMPALSAGFIQDVITAFLADRPKTTVSMHSRSSQKVIEWVAAQQIDLGITALAVDHPGVETEFLCRVEAVCVLPAGHRLEDKEIVEATDLAGEPFVSLSPLDGSRPRIDNAFESAGVRRDLRIDTPMAASACAFVAKGAGVTIVDPISAFEFRRLPTVVKPFRPVVPFDFSLRYPLHRRRSRLATAFAAEVRTHLQSIGDLPLIDGP